MALSHTHIHGGEEFSGPPNLYPWLASMHVAGESPLNSHFGAAVLIAPNWVLTVAHNFRERHFSEIQLNFGSGPLMSHNIGSYRIESEPYVLDKFDPIDLEHDIAIVRLARECERTPITLVSQQAHHDLSQPDTMATVLGWGKSGPYSGISTNLKIAQLPIITNEEAEDILEQPIFPSMICAGGNSIDAICRGDSGGPLFASYNNELNLLGLICDADNCGVTYSPSVFTAIAPYLSWIQEVTGVTIN